jgi:hypothetical protein
MPNLPFCIHSRLPLPDFDTRPKISCKFLFRAFYAFLGGDCPRFAKVYSTIINCGWNPNSTTRKGDATFVHESHQYG